MGEEGGGGGGGGGGAAEVKLTLVSEPDGLKLLYSSGVPLRVVSLVSLDSRGQTCVGQRVT